MTSNQQQDWKKEYNSNISESDNEKTNTSMVIVTMSSQLSAFKLFVEAAEESGVKFVENGLGK